MVGMWATYQPRRFEWVKWSELGWPRLVDTPPERQMTLFPRTTPAAAPAVVTKTTVESPSRGGGAADGGDNQEGRVPEETVEEETVEEQTVAGETVLGERVPAPSPPATALPDEGNHTMGHSSSLLADLVVDNTGSAAASPAEEEVAPSAAEPDSAADRALEALIAEATALLAETAASQDDAEFEYEKEEDPGYAGGDEETPEVSDQEEMEDRVPSPAEEAAVEPAAAAPAPAEPTTPVEDDAGSVSSASSAHTVQRPSEVAKGKRKCVDFASFEEHIPPPSFPERSFPLLRHLSRSRSSLCVKPPVRTKQPILALMGYEEGESSRPCRSILQALGLRDSEWDDSIYVPYPEQSGVVPEPVTDQRTPVTIRPIPTFPLSGPFGDVTDHVHDLPTPVGTRAIRVGTQPTMSGALPVPTGWQRDPVETPRPAEVPKVRWTSLLIPKLRNAILPKPILRLILGREVADQVKVALQLNASGAT